VTLKQNLHSVTARGRDEQSLRKLHTGLVWSGLPRPRAVRGVCPVSVYLKISNRSQRGPKQLSTCWQRVSSRGLARASEYIRQVVTVRLSATEPTVRGGCVTSSPGIPPPPPYKATVLVESRTSIGMTGDASADCTARWRFSDRVVPISSSLGVLPDLHVFHR
jgi:hypothetical protein